MWYKISRTHYDRELVPKEVYKVGNRTYVLPDLPVHGSVSPFVLKENFLIAQRELLENITKLFDSETIEYWISGGTLLGYTLHKTCMPWDDDIDIHTCWKNRELLFSDSFSKIVSKYGLEVFFLLNSTPDFATKEGAAVRIRKKNTNMPVCDVFFVKELKEKEDKMCKIDSWSGNDITPNERERWKKEYLFPIVRKRVDDLELNFPANPEKVLQTQYGEKVLERMVVRSPWISHSFPYEALSFVWKSK